MQIWENEETGENEIRGVLGLGRTEVSFRITMNFVIIRLQRFSGQPKASVNWGQPYIKE